MSMQENTNMWNLDKSNIDLLAYYLKSGYSVKYESNKNEKNKMPFIIGSNGNKFLYLGIEISEGISIDRLVPIGIGTLENGEHLPKTYKTLITTARTDAQRGIDLMRRSMTEEQIKEKIESIKSNAEKSFMDNGMGCVVEYLNNKEKAKDKALGE